MKDIILKAIPSLKHHLRIRRHALDMEKEFHAPLCLLLPDHNQDTNHWDICFAAFPTDEFAIAQGWYCWEDELWEEVPTYNERVSKDVHKFTGMKLVKRDIPMKKLAPTREGIYKCESPFLENSNTPTIRTQRATGIRCGFMLLCESYSNKPMFRDKVKITQEFPNDIPE